MRIVQLSCPYRLKNDNTTLSTASKYDLVFDKKDNKTSHHDIKWYAFIMMYEILLFSSKKRKKEISLATVGLFGHNFADHSKPINFTTQE